MDDFYDCCYDELSYDEVNDVKAYDLCIDFGFQIAEVMNRKGISLEGLADRIGIDKEELHRKLCGDPLTVEDMARIADGVGLGLSYMRLYQPEEKFLFQEEEIHYVDLSKGTS